MTAPHAVETQLDPKTHDELVRVFCHANPNILRSVLFYLTGNEELRTMKTTAEERRGGAFIAQVLSQQDQARVAELATDYWLEFGRREPDRVDIPRARLAVEILNGREVTDTEFQLARYQLQLETEQPTPWQGETLERASRHRVLIVGGGVSGIAMAVKLAKYGIPYSLIESQGNIGGTWERNQFPEARVDTSSFVYQYSFVKHYRWPEQYATQEEVKKYLNHVADSYGVTPNARLNTSLVKAQFNDQEGCWHVWLEDSSGKQWQEQATAIVSAAGLFSNPKYPEIPGLETFGGPVVHSAAWDADFDPSGLHVCIIGNGSTGVQIMPWLAKHAQQVTVMQRTPQWISPMEGYKSEISPEMRWLHENMPLYWLWSSYGDRVVRATLGEAQIYDPSWQARGGMVSRRNDGLRASLTKYIGDQLVGREDLISQVTPEYAPLARRLVVDNGWYKALLEPNVALICDGIAEIREDHVETLGGEIVKCDALVLATGFEVEKYTLPAKYVDASGRELQDYWTEDGPRAYAGIEVPWLPNFFMMYGPNAQGRGGSFITLAEIWADYIANVIRYTIERGAQTAVVKEAKYRDYNAAIDRALGMFIWKDSAPPGKNYYVNSHGRQNVNMPWSLAEYMDILSLDPELTHEFSE